MQNSLTPRQLLAISLVTGLAGAAAFKRGYNPMACMVFTATFLCSFNLTVQYHANIREAERASVIAQKTTNHSMSK
jgi:DMSO reductase anchor subunit